MFKKAGFTLIEMLIVISIIGTLASVILVGFGSLRGRGRDARRIADLHQVRNALELYFIANQSYPPNGGWVNMETDVINASIGVFALSNDPLPLFSYDYSPSNCSGGLCLNYALSATLEDPTNPALDNSPKGTVYGLNCDVPTYCVQF